MRLICEHEAICRALALAGVGEAYIVCRLPLDEVGQWETKDVAFVAWSPEHAVLRRPENSLAAVPGVTFLRLPSSLGSLTAARAHRKATGSGMMRVDLCVPLGQFLFAVQRLLDLLPTEQPGKVLVRVAELTRFSTMHWPGWFEPALDIVRSNLQKRGPTGAGELAKMLMEFAGPVATYETFRPFLHGAGKDIINAGPGPIKAALTYHLTGGLPYQEILDLLEADGWWPGFAEELTDVKRRLEEIRLSGSDPKSVLGERLDSVRQNLAGFARTAERLLQKLSGCIASQSIPSELREAERCLGAIIGTVQSIAGDRGTLREQLDERIRHVANALR